MRVCRAAPEEIMRQAEYLINRQRYVFSFSRSRSRIQSRHRFSEMREEQPAVKVMRYLQTDVADHTTNPKETGIFPCIHHLPVQ